MSDRKTNGSEEFEPVQGSSEPSGRSSANEPNARETDSSSSNGSDRSSTSANSSSGNEYENPSIRETAAQTEATHSSDYARENPLAAAKSRGEIVGDMGAAASSDAKSTIGSAVSGGKDKLNSGISRVAEGEGAAASAARGVQAAQKATETARNALETAKAIAVSAKGLIVTLANPATWITIAVVIVLAFVSTAVVTSFQVYGTNDAVENCSSNGSVTGVDVPTDASMEENRDAMMSWLMKNNFKSNDGKPLTKEQAAAVAGNFAAESSFGFDVTEGHVMDGASNDAVDAWTRGGPRGLGMAQWTWNPGRAGTLIELAKGMSKNWYDPEVQFQMILNEMDGAYGPRLKSAGFFNSGKKPGELAIVFHDIYEGSADDAAKKARRSQMAEDAYANGKSAGGSYNPTGGDNCQQGSENGGGNGDWVYPLQMRNDEPLGWTTYFGGGHEDGAMDINGTGNGGAPTDWPVYSASDGEVISMGDGNCSPLTIWHEKDKVSTIYQHLNSKVVSLGDSVKAGQHIGGVGTKGCGSTGNHLHFGVLPDNKWGVKNPAWAWMKEKGVDMGRCMSSSDACALAGAPSSL